MLNTKTQRIIEAGLVKTNAQAATLIEAAENADTREYKKVFTLLVSYAKTGKMNPENQIRMLELDTDTIRKVGPVCSTVLQEFVVAKRRKFAEELNFLVSKIHLLEDVADKLLKYALKQGLLTEVQAKKLLKNNEFDRLVTKRLQEVAATAAEVEVEAEAETTGRGRRGRRAATAAEVEVEEEAPKRGRRGRRAATAAEVEVEDYDLEFDDDNAADGRQRRATMRDVNRPAAR